MKLTKELRRRCVCELRAWAARHGLATCDALTKLADALAACEVEEEPVKWREAHDALRADGWTQITGDHWIRGDRVCIVYAGVDYVKKTAFCPPDLLDGRLAALDEET